MRWRYLFATVLLTASALAWTEEPVQLAVRHPGHAVRILGTTHVVHELWITNRSPSSISLDEVAVLSESGPLVQLREGELPAHIGRPGLARNHPTPRVLEAGQQAVVYFWIPLQQDLPAPARLEHRVSVSLGGPSSASRADTVIGGATRVVPVDETEVLDAPLRGPGWVAVYEPGLPGGHRTAIYTTDDVPRIPGRFAIDWIRLPPGAARIDPTSRPPDWNGFGAEVLAVKDARVASAVDGHPDADTMGKPRVPITRDNAAGNYLSLDLGNGRFAFYEHLQEGSVRVRAGDRVTAGQVIARVGSSGSVSSGPHLHFHVSDANSLLAAEGLPFLLRTFRTRGAFASIAAFAKGDPAVPHDTTTDRSIERPAANAIVDFSPSR